MRILHLKSEIAQLSLSDLGRQWHVNMPCLFSSDDAMAKNFVLSHPFFDRSRAGKVKKFYALRGGRVSYPIFVK
jgi:hypothetical protein